MRLCSEVKLWNRLIAEQSAPRLGKKPRSPYKDVPRLNDPMKITVTQHGTRFVAVEKNNRPQRGYTSKTPKLLRRSKSPPKIRSVKSKTKRDGKVKEQTQNMATQAERDDLEFLLTDPTINGPQIQDEVAQRNSNALLYSRETFKHREYKSGSNVVDIRHHTVDNIMVSVSEQTRSDQKVHYSENSEDRTKNMEKENKQKENSEKETDKAPVSSDATEKDKQEQKPVADFRKSPRLKMTSKPSEHRLTMVRVGGGWMELPDYLRHHIPKHVHEQRMPSGVESNFVIRSQRPRTALVCKEKEIPSWAATLSRVSRGSAATVNMHALK